MDEQSLRQYLANILRLAGLDGVPNPTELAAFQTICAEFQAKKRDIKEAEALAANPDFQIKAMGRYSDKIKLLEDLLYVAICDGDLGGAEKQIIIGMAKELGISQAQVNAILEEAKSRRDSDEAITICGSCNNEIASSSKFCPHCGTPFGVQTEIPDTQGTFNYPSSGISIEFAHSTAANFSLALEMARKAGNFQEREQNKKKWYLASWPLQRIGDSLQLVDCIKGLRNKTVYLEGQITAWDVVFGFADCCARRQNAYRPVEYCFGIEEKQLNLWGCKQGNMPWTSWTRWLSYGRFSGEDRFIFDKKRIRHELESNLYNLRFCPNLHLDLVEKVLELFPAEVPVSLDSTSWTYNRIYERTPSSIKIVSKRGGGGFTITDEFYSDGVRPVGFSTAIGILKRALKACAMKEVELTNFIE